MVDFSKASIGFSAMDLLSSTMTLVVLYKEFVILGIALPFAPKIFGLAKKALFGGGGRRAA